MLPLDEQLAHFAEEPPVGALVEALTADVIQPARAPGTLQRIGVLRLTGDAMFQGAGRLLTRPAVPARAALPAGVERVLGVLTAFATQPHGYLTIGGFAPRNPPYVPLRKY